MKIIRHLIAFVAMIVAIPSMVAADSYALVNISTAYVRSKPSHSAELVTQQLMGFPVKIVETQGEWSRVETIDGYDGYIINNTLHAITPQEYGAWKCTPRVIVKSNKELAITNCCGRQVSDVVPGAILVLDDDCGGDTTIVNVLLPDKRKGTLPVDAVMPLEQWRAQPLAIDQVISYGMDNLGAPYLWGGMSPKGMDCSGLTWTAFWLNGRLLKRDASKQALMGAKITDWHCLKAGDLAFFGNPATLRISHVALLRDDDGNIVHSSGGRVRLNSLDPAAPDCISAKFLWGISADNLLPIADDAKASWLFSL